MSILCIIYWMRVCVCEPISFSHNLLRWCSILVLIRFHGSSGLRPTGIAQRFPPKCHLTVFNLCYPPWPSWCMCPVGCGLASGLRLISSLVCPSALYVRYSVLLFKIVCEGKYLFIWFLQPSKEYNCWTLGLGCNMIESIGNQKHVAYKDFRSYCSHHPIELSLRAFVTPPAKQLRRPEGVLHWHTLHPQGL